MNQPVKPGDSNLARTAVAPAGEPAASPGPWLSWWFEANDLVLISGPSAEQGTPVDAGKPKAVSNLHGAHVTAVLDCIEAKQKNVTTHPGFAAAVAEGQDIKGFESDGLFFIELGGQGGLFGGLFEGPFTPHPPGLGLGALSELTGRIVPSAKVPGTGLALPEPTVVTVQPIAAGPVSASPVGLAAGSPPVPSFRRPDSLYRHRSTRKNRPLPFR